MLVGCKSGEREKLCLSMGNLAVLLMQKVMGILWSCGQLGHSILLDRWGERESVCVLAD